MCYNTEELLLKLALTLYCDYHNCIQFVSICNILHTYSSYIY